MTSATRWIGAGLGLAMAGYGATVCAAYLRFGRRRRQTRDSDPWLDRFMPLYDIAERHRVRVSAPASVTLAAALDTDLEESAIIGGIIRARELVLGARPDRRLGPDGLLARMTSIGWGVLAEDPGREVVVGAVTQPWLPEVVFRPLPADAFAAFAEPGFVKIAWTVGVDPVSASTSEFRTETRAVATDPTARRKFRWYWARFSPGVVIIRQVVLRMVKAEAERRIARPDPALGRRPATD
ncbi:hypothetical protein TBR22_A14260 [Luteitalea sp. TBR-22]|nr:hypothetical protein TBR22_A14260 [Luteitalea sp. TBR-22]